MGLWYYLAKLISLTVDRFVLGVKLYALGFGP
jgi:hypothetical protein